MPQSEEFPFLCFVSGADGNTACIASRYSVIVGAVLLRAIV